MTKDLVICVTGNSRPAREEYLSTEEFIEAVETNLKAALGAN